MMSDPPAPAPSLDGSAAAMLRCLRELSARMAPAAGDAGADAELPVLELRFGDIVTTTSLSAAGPPPHLQIAILLPPLAAVGPGIGFDAAWGKACWDADAGRYVILRMLPLAGIADERDLFDAIMTSKDAASAWLRRLAAPVPGRRQDG